MTKKKIKFDYVYDWTTEKEIKKRELYSKNTDYSYDDYSGTKDSEYYANYIKAIESEKLYDTGKKLTTNDKTLTLQTCISGYTGELFEILVLKLIDTQTY